MAAAAERTPHRRIGVVDAVFDRADAAQIREDVPEIGIGHRLETDPRRGGAQYPDAADLARADRLDERGFRVIRDVRWILRDVRGRHDAAGRWPDTSRARPAPHSAPC